jgi:peptide methionine sulfoxide reductase MsrB
MSVLDAFFGKKDFAPPCVMGDESIMSPKAHGTSATPVQKDLRWKCDYDTADRICNFNRHYAEYAGYWLTTSFVEEARSAAGKEITFYDSNTGKPLFIAPKGRSMEEFLKESGSHGWPSFRDEEVIWENVRCLADGEAVSVDGTHLGHNLPDGSGNRYCINLVSVAGRPVGGEEDA